MIITKFKISRNFNFKRIRLKLLLNVSIIGTIVLIVSNFLYTKFLTSHRNTDGDLISSSLIYELRTKPFFKPKHPYTCSELIDNNFDHVTNGERTLKRRLKSDLESYKLFSNCTILFENHYYPIKSSSNRKETDFPLAYILLVNEHLEQLEILLNAIYAPQNVYCIHVDFKSSYIIHSAMEKLASCFDNVFVSRDRIAVTHGGATMLHAQKSCLKELYYGNKITKIVNWKYVILLQGHDFPLKSNREIVEILKIHKGANDVELLPTPLDRFYHKFEPIFDGYGFPFDFRETNHRKSSPPHGLTIYKGSVATVLNREIVAFSLESKIAQDLLDWLNDALMPDELFWSTINHNEFLRIPGGYPGQCVHHWVGYKTWISRFAIWEQYEHLHCNGTWRHSVCLFNSGDLHMLSKRPELFLNKFWMHFDSVALDCMHELLFNRTHQRKDINSYYDLDISYYKLLSSVQYQVWKLQNPDGNITNFKCVLCKQCSH